MRFPPAVISLSRYKALLRPREIKQTFAASILGRLPIGLTGLAILLMVQAQTASFAQAGSASAAYVVGLAGIGPVLGRLIDRYGPGAILFGCSLAFPAGLVGLVFAVTELHSPLLTLALAGLSGASFPPISVCMRTYLRQRFATSPLLPAAYSLESVLIEFIFILGPLLVALLVATVSAAAAVLFSAACGGIGTMLFLRSPALRAWQVVDRRHASVFGPLAQPGFPSLIAVIVCYCTAFGLLEIGITAYAADRGTPALAGVLLGLMSTGSALGGLAYGSRNWHSPLGRQFALMLALMGTGLGLLALPTGLGLFAPLCFFAGVVMAPALIIQSMLVAKAAPEEHMTEAFTWSSSALLGGVGLGIAAGGALLATFRWPAVLLAAACAAAAAAAGAWRLRRS